MAYFPTSYFRRSKAKYFYIIREDDPYIIYATRELAEKQLQRIIDLQHTGNIIKKDIKTEKDDKGLTLRYNNSISKNRWKRNSELCYKIFNRKSIFSRGEMK